MKCKILVLSFLLCFSEIGKAQDSIPLYSAAIKTQAEQMGQLLLKKDYDGFTRFTYPKILQMMGGKQKMIDVLVKGANEMQSGGYEISELTIGEPSNVVLKGTELQCTVPETLVMKVPNGRLVTKSTLIGISMDKGKHWYFVDTSNKDLQEMKKILPNLSNALVIPGKTKPLFYPE